jgi:UDP-N-acetylmuramyl pentapeptide phosphotransferase/UDP-N-acetylglucosamine-1-phosphate transferase
MSELTSGLAIAALVAAAASAATIGVLIPVARRLGVLVDVPNPRSSHRVPRLRGGGLGVLFGILAGVLVSTRLTLPFGRGALILLAGAGVLALMGLWDDLRSLPASARLLTQLVVATSIAVSIGGLDRFPLPAPLDISLGPIGVPLAVLWLVGVTNFFNFMDGIDGLAGGQALATCAGVMIAGWSLDASRISSILAGGVLGFLVFNWPPARVFLGDVGSMPIGFLLAGFPLLAAEPDRSSAVLAAAVGLALFLLDPVWTLVRRVRNRRPLGQAHREHVYQRFLAPEEPHGPVTLSLVAAAIFLAMLGAYAFLEPPARWAAVALAVAMFVVESGVARSTESRREGQIR